jgi:leader peptidase (prepilin peptidase)/N-methyltransferase
VLSWLLLRGAARPADAHLGLRYPLVELATGLLFAAVAWRFGPTPVALLWCGLVATLLAAGADRLGHHPAARRLTLPLLWAGLVAAALGWLNLPLPGSVWGVVDRLLSLWSVYWLFKLATGKEGMGFGDFKLLAALGAWLAGRPSCPSS